MYTADWPNANIPYFTISLMGLVTFQSFSDSPPIRQALLSPEGPKGPCVPAQGVLPRGKLPPSEKQIVRLAIFLVI